MAVEEEHLVRVLSDFRDELDGHRHRLAGQIQDLEQAYSVLSREVAGRAADEFLQRSRHSREAFTAYAEAVRDITHILTERIDALRGA